MYVYKSQGDNQYISQVHRTIFRHFVAQYSNAPDKQKGSLLLLAMPIVSFGLGTWQVYRLQWKKSLIQELEDRTMKEPLEISDNK